MFCSRCLNNVLNHICKNTQTYDDSMQSFPEILDMSNGKTKFRMSCKINLQIVAWFISTHIEQYFEKGRKHL